MLRAFLVLIAGIFLGWAGHQPALAQLRTLSPGNAEAQWRDAQVSLFDQQLAQPQLPPELAAELVAQRTWLSAWTPKQSSSTASVPAAPVPEAQAEAATKPTALRQEPILDPNQLATPYRQALFASQSGPTAEDTAALQLALEKHSGDLGLRQLQMHWIDQPRYRNEYWREIDEACGRVLALLEKEQQTEEVKLAAAFACYRRSRAMCHALEGAAQADSAVAGATGLKPEELQSMRDSIGQAARQVQELVGAGQPEFFQLQVYQLRRDRWHGQALQLLEMNKERLDPSAYLAEKVALLDALAWEAPAKQAKSALEAFPVTERHRLEIRWME